MAYKMKGSSFYGKSPLKQKEEKKIHQKQGMFGIDTHQFTKGARQGEGGVTKERGKLTRYTPTGDTYTKQVFKKKKGSAPGPSTWEHKKTKEISKKRAEKQIKRKSKRYTKI